MDDEPGFGVRHKDTLAARHFDAQANPRP